MSDPFIGEIRVFGFTLVPEGWAPCDGQTLMIAAHTALFNIIGRTYGGDSDTFCLPDFMNRVPLAAGANPNLSPRVAGDKGGSETAMVSVAQMPAHSHGLNGCDADATTAVVAGQLPAKGFWDSGTAAGVVGAYSNAAAPDTTMESSALTVSGGDAPHPNLQPYLVLNFCIAMQGVPPYGA